MYSAAMSGETRIQVTKRIAENGERCLYCHEDFEESAIKVTCPQCDSPQHRSCAMFYERCPTMGCTATWAELSGAGQRSEGQLSERAEALIAAHSKISSGRAEHLRGVGRKFVLSGIVLFALICFALATFLKNVNFWELF